jgi:hypothetical protein
LLRRVCLFRDAPSGGGRHSGGLNLNGR